MFKKVSQYWAEITQVLKTLLSAKYQHKAYFFDIYLTKYEYIKWV